MWILLVLFVASTSAASSLQQIPFADGEKLETLTVFFIRHAESDWNKASEAGLVSKVLKAVNPGTCDSPLTEQGVHQTQLWNQFVMTNAGLGAELRRYAACGRGISYVSSPLQRTYETITSVTVSLGMTGQHALHILPALRETSTGPDAASFVMGQCRKLHTFSASEGHQQRAEKWLLGGRHVPRLQELAHVWQQLVFHEEASENFNDYLTGTKTVPVEDDSYVRPFLEDMFEIAKAEGSSAVLVSTHSIWIRSFAAQVLAGTFGPPPAASGNWGVYVDNRVANSHIIRVQITRAAEGNFIFGSDVVEQPPSGMPIEEYIRLETEKLPVGPDPALPAALDCVAYVPPLVPMRNGVPIAPVPASSLHQRLAPAPIVPASALTQRLAPGGEKLVSSQLYTAPNGSSFPIFAVASTMMLAAFIIYRRHTAKRRDSWPLLDDYH